MLLGMELFLLFYGFYALFKGKYTINKQKVITGSWARFCGFLCILPLPTTFILGIIAVIIMGMMGIPIDNIEADYTWHFVALELSVVVVTFLLVTLIANKAHKHQMAEEMN